MASLQALWMQLEKALARRELRKLVTGIKDDEIEHAGEMLGAAIMSAAREVSAVLDPEA